MNQLSLESDEELWRRYKENEDQQAFGLLMKKYRERVLAFLIRLTGESEESLDLLQETFRRFAQHFDATRSSAKTFLFCIAVNLARTHYKRTKKRWFVSLEELEERDASLVSENDFYRDELRFQIFQQGLNRLPIRDREAIELKDIEGLTYQSAAIIVGCSEKRFEKRLLRARKRLRIILTQSSEYEFWMDHDIGIHAGWI